MNNMMCVNDVDIIYDDIFIINGLPGNVMCLVLQITINSFYFEVVSVNTMPTRCGM